MMSLSRFHNESVSACSCFAAGGGVTALKPATASFRNGAATSRNSHFILAGSPWISTARTLPYADRAATTFASSGARSWFTYVSIALESDEFFFPPHATSATTRHSASTFMAGILRQIDLLSRAHETRLARNTQECPGHPRPPSRIG